MLIGNSNYERSLYINSFESHDTTRGQKLPLDNLAPRSKLIEICQVACAKYCLHFPFYFSYL